MDKKYIIASIRIPLEIVDNNYVPLTEYASVDFEKCDKLPQTSDLYALNINSIIDNFFPKNNEITIHKEEIKKKEPAKNSSFKNKSKSSRRFTIKNNITKNLVNE